MFFPVVNYEFYKKYSSYATSDIKEYINLMAVESNNTPAKDAALVINWEEILKRALNQEKFISQYGNSVKIDKVKDLYKKYLTFALLGTNNTVNAGSDIVLVCHGHDNEVAVIDALKKAVENGTLTEERVDKSVYRILKLKYKYKLTDSIKNSINIEKINNKISAILDAYLRSK